MKSGLSARQAVATGLMLCAFAVSLCVLFVARLGPTGLWPCSGFLAAALFTTRSKGYRLAIIVGAVVVDFALARWGAVAVIPAMLHAQWDVTEAATGAYLAHRVLGPRDLLRTPGGFLKLQALAVLPACLLAGVGFVVEMALLRAPLVWSMQASILAHLLGMATVLPAMLLMVQPPLPELRRSWRETAAVLAGVAIILLIMSRQVGPPALIITPTLLFATFRLGPRGAAMSSLILSLVTFPIVASGGGPFGLHPGWDINQRIAIFQVTVVSLLFGVTLIAFILAQQARITRLLARRAEIARTARRRALDASRAKTEFLATMSHEVRTPMNSILGFTELLARDARLAPDVHDKLGMIASAGGSLMALLGDVLDFSKIEAGQIDLNLESVDVVETCRDVVNVVSAAAAAKGLTVKFEAGSQVVGQFRADDLRLRQILLNLLNNAVKFTAEGEIRLSVKVVGADGGAPCVRFEVADTGIGIEPDVISRLFTRFYQADSSISRNYGGSGLGLAISKGLVERMHGRMGVESHLGLGSTFWFEAPLERMEDADGEERADAATERLPLHARILLVDDHPVNRQLGQALLEMLGCRVDLAEDGEQAVVAAAKGGYDAILMDVHMPRMDGLAATRAILAIEGPVGQTPIIGLSADVLPHNIALCKAAGMVEHVPKPVQLDVLYTVLKRQIGRAPLPAASVA
jgi:signal transduction histidine kinase/ActR/RegA family two-component response regulator